MNIAILSVGFLLAVCQVLGAQAEETGINPEAKGRLAWFVCLDLPEGIENPATVMTGKDISQVILSKSSPSLPVGIPADGILKIVRKVENPGKPEVPAYTTLAQAQISDSVGKALIILLPVDKQADGTVFRANVLDLASFKGGDTLYLNLTNARIGVEMGRTVMEVKPGTSKMYQSPALSAPVSQALRFSYFDPAVQQWKRFASSNIAVYPTQREICVFAWNSKFERIDYDSITFPVDE